MARTLKEQFQDKRLREVSERARRREAQMINEARAARLIVEAMDQEDLNKVSEIVKKLTTLKTPMLPKLKAAIEKAEAELNKYTAGGPIAQAWSKLKTKMGIDNPVVKVAAFADALERGFSQIPQILKNNGVDLKGADTNRSLAYIVAGMGKDTNRVGFKSGKEMAKSPVTGKEIPSASDDPLNVPSQNEAAGDQQVDSKWKTKNDHKLDSIIQQLQKAMTPAGIFAALRGVPYIDKEELATELVNAPINVFSAIAKRVNSGAKAAEIAPDLKDQATGTGGAETKGTGESQPPAPAAQTKPAEPAKDPTATTGTTAAGETTPTPQGGGAPQNLAKAVQKVKAAITAARAKNGGMDIEALTKKLVDAGLDPEKL